MAAGGLRDRGGGLLDTEDVAVKQEMIILVLAPLAARVEVVIRGAAAVGLGDEVKGRGARKLGVAEHHALTAGLGRRKDKDRKALGILTENVIGAAANEHTASLGGAVTDIVGLVHKQAIVDRQVGDGGGGGNMKMRAHREGVKQTAGRPLVLLFRHVGVEVGRLSRARDDLTVIERNAQKLSHAVADLSAARAILSCHGYQDLFVHNGLSFFRDHRRFFVDLYL